MYITYGKVFGGLQTFWYFSYFLKIEAFQSEWLTGNNSFIQIYKIMQ